LDLDVGDHTAFRNIVFFIAVAGSAISAMSVNIHADAEHRPYCSASPIFARSRDID
jgi:hypothetical protein